MSPKFPEFAIAVHPLYKRVMKKLITNLKVYKFHTKDIIGNGRVSIKKLVK